MRGTTTSRSRTLFKDNSIPPTPVANAELIGFGPVVGLSSVPKGRQKQHQPPTPQAENARSFIIFFRRELGRFIALRPYGPCLAAVLSHRTGVLFPCIPIITTITAI